MRTLLISAGFLLAILAHAFAQSSTPVVAQNSSDKITTGLTYQVLVTAGTRRALVIQNNNTNGDNCFVDPTGTVANGNTTTTNVTVGGVSMTSAQVSVLLQPGQSYTRNFPVVPNNVITGTCATTSDSIYVEVD